MKRTFESGYQKRKRKQEWEEQQKALPKLDKYFIGITKDRDSVLQIKDDLQNPKQTPGDSVDHAIMQPADTSESNIVRVVERSVDSETVENASNAAETGNCHSTLCHSMKTLSRSNDFGKYTSFSREDVTYWAVKGPSDCQHWDSSFENSKRVYKNQARYCSKNLFQCRRVNGEIYNREWLLYSPTTGSVYCFVCKLFKPSTSPLCSEGFSDWRNLGVIKNHENSESHREALLIYLSQKNHSTLECKLAKNVQEQQQYWRNVLERVVATICTLAERGLAFRGSNEHFGSVTNGNYLGILELIAKFDPFLATHINQHKNKGSGTPSYLSKTICDEMIIHMANRVRESILNELIKSKYFSLSVDSTPDLSHVDQLTVIVRYVSPENGLPVERFLTFLELKDHTGEHMAAIVVAYLTKNCKIDFSKCRGQSYDNAANMSGKYKGMKQKILEINKHAIYIPCAGHSLNLVGRSAVDYCLHAVNFFNVQEVYVFFSSSTKRWDVMLRFLKTDKNVPKSLSDTRWSAHAKSVSAIYEHYETIVEALDHFHEDENEKGDTRIQAGSLHEKMEEFEFVIMLCLWNHLLLKFDKVNKALQDPQITLYTCKNLYSSLSEFVRNMREEFDVIEEKAKSKLPDVEYKSTRKRKRKTMINDGTAPDASEDMHPREKFRVMSFIPILDALYANLNKRAEVYNYVADKFSFLANLNSKEEKLHDAVTAIVNEYPNDIDMGLESELKHFHIYVKQNNSENKEVTHTSLYQIIFKDNLRQAFPNVECILRIFLCLMLTNCSGERSFSQLKRIKNELRTNMSQKRLEALSLLCIEKEKLRTVSFDDIINDFATSKSRKTLF